MILLNRQFELIEHLVSHRQSLVLESLEKVIEQNSQSIFHVYQVYEYTYSLIDNLVRFQKIANVVPKISQKSPELVAYNRAMGNLKNARNQIQHINNDIENNYTGPLLGSICWTKQNEQYLVSFNDVGRERSVPGIALNMQTGQFLEDLCYIYNEELHNLGEAIRFTRSIYQWISSLVEIRIDDKPYNPADHFTAIRMVFHLQ